MKNLIFLLSLVSILISCSNRTFQPLYQQLPEIEVIPPYKLFDPRTVPPNESLELSFNVVGNAHPEENSYYNNPGAFRSREGKAPTVIIATPREIEVSGTKIKQFDAQEKTDDSVFKTDGYFNEAEQAVEKALIRIGFDVLDRSKFEAKLRDLRDRSNIRPGWYYDWTEDLLESGEYDVLKDQYKKQLENGIITPSQYAEIINEVDKMSQRGLPGNKREEDEMNDIAEVIRAAQTGVDQAEYLLQINEVKVVDAGQKSLRIEHYPEVWGFVNQHHGLGIGYSSKDIPPSIESRWFKATCNAKLIEVKTGSIVWIGSHEIESSSAQTINIRFGVEKNVRNEDDVNAVIYAHNQENEILSKQLHDLRDQLLSLYQKAATKKKLGSNGELITYTQNIKQEISETEKEFNSKMEDFRYLQHKVPMTSTKNWEYEYRVGKPVVYPDLISVNYSDKQEVRRLQEHKRQLVKIVTQELINTIRIQ